MATGSDREVTAADVDELRTAVVTLAARVTGLSESLNTVNDIQIRQTSTERKTAVIEKEAEKARQSVADLTAKAVTQEQMTDAVTLQERKVTELRKKTLQRIYLVGITTVLIVAVCVVGVVAFQLNRQAAAHDNCVSREKQDMIIIDVLEGSIKGQPSSPGVRNIQDAIQRFKMLSKECR